MKKHIICLIKILCICPKLAFGQPWLGPRFDKNTSACYEGRTMDFLYKMHSVRINNTSLTTEEACLIVFNPKQDFDPFSAKIYLSKQDLLSTLQLAAEQTITKNKKAYEALIALQEPVSYLPNDERL